MKTDHFGGYLKDIERKNFKITEKAHKRAKTYYFRIFYA